MDLHANLVSVIGILTVFFSVLVKVIGIPAQIRQKFTRQSTEGVSFSNQAIGFLAYCFWMAYGILRHDPVLIYGQTLGVLTTAIVLYQFAVYRNRKREQREPTLLRDAGVVARKLDRLTS
jgi:uncharacterized protein with PQ loop repeat